MTHLALHGLRNVPAGPPIADRFVERRFDRTAVGAVPNRRLHAVLLVACAVLPLGGCATTRSGSTLQAEHDPLEGFNRVVWGANRGIDTVVLKPVSNVYRTVVPRPARRGVSGVFQNLAEPWSFVNNMLQLRPKRAFQNLSRFVVNTTLGVGGIGEPATKFGIKSAPEDFGQTLGRWGVGGGGYVVLPLFGPSTLRDGVGIGVGIVADPAQFALSGIGVSNGQQLGLTAIEVIDGRAQMTEAGVDDFLKASLDPYAAARSAFLQRRRGEILNAQDADDDNQAASGVQDGDGGQSGQTGQDPLPDATGLKSTRQIARQSTEAVPVVPVATLEAHTGSSFAQGPPRSVLMDQPVITVSSATNVFTGVAK